MYTVHFALMNALEHSGAPCVSALYVYPIKSTAPIKVDELALDALGAVGDRRWMVVRPDGVAITARDVPMLALVQTRFAGASTPSGRNVDGPLTVSSVDQSDLHIAIPTLDATTRRVEIWDDTVDALDAGDEASAWFSEVLSRDCRLVRLSPIANRALATRFAGPIDATGRQVALSDGAPLLLLGQGSVDALNARIALHGGAFMDVRRFRPNVLLADIAPHEEDSWASVQIGSVHIGVGSTCKRCVLTTVDPDTGQRGVEPLRTLATYRREGGQVVFAMNATHATPGVIRRGDLVTVQARKAVPNSAVSRA